jgi:hypothetical protein
MNDYKILITKIAFFLNASGYKKIGGNFYYKEENNIGIINFQKSKDSTSASTLFTVNLGVYSEALKVFDNFDIKSKPSIADCHWRKRIGYLMAGKQDYWWEINDAKLSSNLITEIIFLLKETAIPEIQRHISDKSLEQYWTEGNADGLTEQQMYLYLIGLLKIYNKPNLHNKVDELIVKSNGKPFYNNVKENLLKLGITYV